MITQECLLLGAGHGIPLRKLLTPTSVPESETRWVTLDMNPVAQPDVLFDLNRLEQPNHWYRSNRLPFKNCSFDEVHAYEVMEHFGKLGDYRGFFRTFKELWRILKPNGYFIGTSPNGSSEWAWGDPGHTRVICNGTLGYLTRGFYAQLGKSPASDYRRYVDPCWWELSHSEVDGCAYRYALRKLTE